MFVITYECSQCGDQVVMLIAWVVPDVRELHLCTECAQNNDESQDRDGIAERLLDQVFVNGVDL